MKNLKNTIVFDLSGTLASMRPAKLLIPKFWLKRLSKNYRLAIVTGAKRTETINILKKIGIINYFPLSNIITKDDLTLRKPNPKIFKFLPGQISLYTGDAPTDAKMAQAAGINFIYIQDLKKISL